MELFPIFWVCFRFFVLSGIFALWSYQGFRGVTLSVWGCFSGLRMFSWFVGIFRSGVSFWFGFFLDLERFLRLRASTSNWSVFFNSERLLRFGASSSTWSLFFDLSSSYAVTATTAGKLFFLRFFTVSYFGTVFALWNRSFPILEVFLTFGALFVFRTSSYVSELFSCLGSIYSLCRYFYTSMLISYLSIFTLFFLPLKKKIRFKKTVNTANYTPN